MKSRKMIGKKASYIEEMKTKKSGEMKTNEKQKGFSDTKKKHERLLDEVKSRQEGKELT